MPADLSVVHGPYLRDLLDQPRALAATVEALEETGALSATIEQVRTGAFRRIVLTGMGSSFHALHPLHIRLIECGFDSVMEETSELVHYKPRLLDGGSLVIAVSQSGRSAEIVRLLDISGGRTTVLGVTNTPGSPLATQCAASVMTSAGDEFSVSCKTYITTLAALQWLGALLTGTDAEPTRAALAQAGPAAAAYLGDWQNHVTQLLEMFRDLEHLFLTGRGPSLAAVNTGALIIKESDHFPAEGMGCAAFRHGPFEMVGPKTLVVVFAGVEKTRDLNIALARDIRSRGGHAEVVCENSDAGVFRLPAGPAAASPIFEILPAQMITLALAARANREPGTFTFASKVTTIE